METNPTVIIEVTEILPVLEDIETYANLSAEASVWIAGFLAFFTLVIFCYFAYKFFRIFF